jgi:pimeloyl-ACP methyl ester carboxylesterase
LKIKATVALGLLSFSLVKPLSAQAGVEFGIPVLFVHGFCDGPIGFSHAETAVKTSLQGTYPKDYPKLSSPEEYVAFYDGTDVRFQVPGSTVFTPREKVNQGTRFFLIDFNDGTGAGETYQQIDNNSTQVAQISIFKKAQELAHIVWTIKSITGAPRVMIVGHSMGGLVPRAYIENLSIPSDSSHAAAPYENDIATLITLDTPHGGVEEATWPTVW